MIPQVVADVRDILIKELGITDEQATRIAMDLYNNGMLKDA